MLYIAALDAAATASPDGAFFFGFMGIVSALIFASDCLYYCCNYF